MQIAQTLLRIFNIQSFSLDSSWSLRIQVLFHRVKISIIILK